MRRKHNKKIKKIQVETLKKTLNALILKVSTMSDLRGPLEYQEEALIHLIYVQKWSNPTLFEP
jgi:hypothetical protein